MPGSLLCVFHSQWTCKESMWLSGCYNALKFSFCCLHIMDIEISGRNWYWSIFSHPYHEQIYSFDPTTSTCMHIHDLHYNLTHIDPLGLQGPGSTSIPYAWYPVDVENHSAWPLHHLMSEQWKAHFIDELHSRCIWCFSSFNPCLFSSVESRQGTQVFFFFSSTFSLKKIHKISLLIANCMHYKVHYFPILMI